MTVLVTPVPNGVSFYAPSVTGLLPGNGDQLIQVPGPNNVMLPTQPTSSGLGFLILNGNVWNAAKTGSGSGAINYLLATGNLLVITP
jgi:hypothetical protein